MTRRERGLAAERIALEFERARVGPQNSHRVIDVSARRQGFDIQSVEDVESVVPRYIEVKAYTPCRSILLTERERCHLHAFGERAWLYVVDVDHGRVVDQIRDPVRVLSYAGRTVSLRFKI